MSLFKLSESTAARRRVYLHLVDATDGISPETGEAGGQPQISTNGAAFTNTAATLVAVGNGLYYVELTAGELGTLGFVAIRYKSANTAEFQTVEQVISFNVYSTIENLVWDAVLASHLTAGTTGAKLSGLAGGSGSIPYTHNVTVAGLPIDGAQVWVTTTNSPSAAVIASGVTNSLGQVLLYLDAGTYYFWVQHGGYTFVNPTQVTVS